MTLSLRVSIYQPAQAPAFWETRFDAVGKPIQSARATGPEACPTVSHRFGLASGRQVC